MAIVCEPREQLFPRTAVRSKSPGPAIPAAGAESVARWRADFPLLREQVHGRPLVYLDNAATTQKPQAVLDAIAHFYGHDNANVHRGVHTLSQRATDAFEAARGKVQAFLNAAAPAQIVFVRGATEAINLVAQSFVRPRVGPGDEIVVSTLEHHSNIVPWQQVCTQTGAVLKAIALDETGAVSIAHFESLLGPRTRFVAISHVSNALGSITDVARVCAAARARGIPVLVDGAQAVAHVAVDVRAIDCDFYVFSGHKCLGPTGVGVLYGRAEHLESMPPYQCGGDMVRTVSFDGTEFMPCPHKFEAGTPDIAGAIGLGAAVDYLAQIGIDAIADHEHRLLARGTALLSAIPGVRIIGTAERKAAILSFVVEGVHPHDVGSILDREGVAVRTGHHCAMPAMQHYGLASGTTRASLAFYNTEAEVHRLAEAVALVARTFA
jgi:cysteine desulfurase/selenocysteine lyase